MQKDAVLLSALVVFGSGAAMMKSWGRVSLLGPAALLMAAAVWQVWGGARGRAQGPGPRSLTLWALVLLAGAASMRIALSPRPCDRALERLASSGRVVLVGVIDGVPEVLHDGRWRTLLRVQAANGDPGASGARVSLVVDSDQRTQVRLVPGARVEASGRFYPPQPPANPGEPDMRVVLGCRGVSGTLYVRTPDNISLHSMRRQGVAAALAAALRDHMMAVTRATLPQDKATLLSGMLFGHAPAEMQDRLQATGTAHLFAVSGLHVGLVAAVLCGILAGLGLRGPAVLAPALAGSWLYAAACGMRPSVVRAAMMLSCAGLAALTRRSGSVRGALYLAGLVMVGRNPLLVFDPGAQMSFAAVFSVVHLSPRMRRALGAFPAWLADFISASLAAQVGVIPLGAWYFGQVSPVAIIASVPCLALAGMAVVTGFVAGLVGIIHLPVALVLNTGNAVVLLALERVIDMLAGLPFASFPVARPSLWGILGFYLVLFIAGAPRPVRRALWANRQRLAVLGPAAAAVVVWVAAVRPGALEIVFLSVGQGDSSLIRGPSGRAILVDGGGALGPERDPGAEVVVPYLLRRGVRRLDVVVATHPHKDHIGGLFEAVRRLRVQVLVKPPVPEELRPDLDRRLEAIARGRGVPVVEVVRGGRLDLGDGVTIDFFHPPPVDSGHMVRDLNDLSIVMMVRFRDVQVLFTGDAGPEVLAGLVREGCDLDADILKVPHHGAAGGCPLEVLRAVSPAWAVILVGPNAFGHPATSTLEALARTGAHVLRTDLNGAVTARGWGRRVRIFAMRGT
ncbi:MAG: DNA internalization-related competence protein ComEC/Rec2 [Firmicutes bacterium]|nr:DNA internalization-related competence protein ComEC/Rec2 [Bacillota bacterium]